MKKISAKQNLNVLLLINSVNYLAQIPYYLHNYYYPHHLVPGLRPVLLLGATLVWFIVGYTAYVKKLKYGFRLMVSYLLVEGLFYISTLLSGAFGHQLQNQSSLIKAVFIIGYISGLTSAYYAFRLFRWHNHGADSV
jgi:hypothetical protein